MSSRGFINLPIIIAVTLGLGLGASIFLNIQQHQRAEQDKKLMQGEISDLRYQVKQDQLAAGGSASPSPSPSASASATPSPSASPSSTPAVAGTSSISIGMYEVKLTATDPITDLTYAPIKSGGLTVAGLTTASLLAKYPACKPGPALGMLVRRPKGEKPPSWNKLIKTIGPYTYYYSSYGTTACATDQAGRDALAAARAALTNGVLPTLTN